MKPDKTKYRFEISLVLVVFWAIWGLDVVALIPVTNRWMVDVRITAYILPLMAFFWWGVMKR